MRAALWHTLAAPTIGGAWTAQGLLDGHTLSRCAHTITHQVKPGESGSLCTLRDKRRSHSLVHSTPDRSSVFAPAKHYVPCVVASQLPRTWLLSTLFWVPSHAAVASLLPPQHRPAALTLVGESLAPEHFCRSRERVRRWRSCVALRTDGGSAGEYSIQGYCQWHSRSDAGETRATVATPPR